MKNLPHHEFLYECFMKQLKQDVELVWKKQGALAEAAGISDGHLSDILNRKARASVKTQKAIAETQPGRTVDDFIDQGRRLLSGPDSACRASPSREIGDPCSLVSAGFERKEKALEMLRQLVKIEQAAPDRFLKITGYIESQYHEACGSGSPRKRKRAVGGGAAR